MEEPLLEETKIIFPSKLTPVDVLQFSKKIKIQPLSKKYIFDMSALGHVEPFGMLFAASLLRNFKRQVQTQLNSSNIDPEFSVYVGGTYHQYAAFMGFYQSFGVELGNSPGQAPGSDRYIPLTKTSVKELRESADEQYRPVGEIIEQDARRIANILTQTDEEELHETLTYSLREIIRNVVEHSQAHEIWYAAQYWPQKNIVEVAILDEGIGIKASLLKNPSLTVNDDKQALKLALKPGISEIENASGSYYDEWANSGYGLFMVSEICKRSGKFLLCSGSKAILPKQAGNIFYDSSFVGTAVRIELNINKIGDLSSCLEELRRSAGTPSIKSASVASRI